VLAVVLARKGLPAVAIAILLATGLGLEWMSTWSYTGPHFLDDIEGIPFARYPLLPVLAGTIPGALAAAAAVMAGWEVYGRRGAAPEDEDEPDVEQGAPIALEQV
jgi:hypothetical protein